MSDVMKVGIVGCAEGTHGKVWGELLATEAGARFGMKPVRVWDRAPEAADALAKATGAQAARTPDAAGESVDGVLITELMPDRYLELSRPFLQRGMRVFYNRPFAGSVHDAHEIMRLASSGGAKVYSASALYHTQAGPKARAALAAIRPLRVFSVTGASDHIGFYLPHSIAAMASVLGTGVATVRSMSLHTRPEDPQHATAPVVVYVEYGPDAAAGSVRGTVQMIGPAATWYGFSMSLFGAAGQADEIRFEVTYDLLLETMAGFFRTGEEPVPRAAIVEQTCIYYAALESAKKGGVPVDVRRLVASKER